MTPKGHQSGQDSRPALGGKPPEHPNALINLLLTVIDQTGDEGLLAQSRQIFDETQEPLDRLEKGESIGSVEPTLMEQERRLHVDSESTWRRFEAAETTLEANCAKELKEDYAFSDEVDNVLRQVSENASEGGVKLDLPKTMGFADAADAFASLRAKYVNLIKKQAKKASRTAKRYALRKRWGNVVRELPTLFWGLIVGTLLIGFLTGNIPSILLQLAIGAGLWFVSRYYVDPKVARYVERLQRTDLKKALRDVSHQRVVLLCESAYLEHIRLEAEADFAANRTRHAKPST